jgi:hypothetical protein
MFRLGIHDFRRINQVNRIYNLAREAGFDLNFSWLLPAGNLLKRGGSGNAEKIKSGTESERSHLS